MFKELFQDFYKRFSGKRAFEIAQEVWARDRFSSFSLFKNTAERCYSYLAQSGVSELELIEFPADGKTKVGDWPLPKAWDVEEAELKLIQPDEVVLAKYSQQPASLMMFSASTPQEGIEAEVVSLEPEGNLQGKIVFGQNFPSFEEIITKRGALGIISDELPDSGTKERRAKLPQARAWHNTFLGNYEAKKGFGFSLTQEQGNYLRELLKKRVPIRVKVKVITKTYPGKIYALTGVCKGEPEPGEEILTLGHLFEQGANDNASGVAVLLEIARLLKSLPLKRAIRFFFSYEHFGILEFLSSRLSCFPRKIIAGLNLDMVGAKQKGEEGKLKIVPTPPVAAHFSDFLLQKFLEQAQSERPDFKWDWRSYMIMENFIGDPQIKIPTPGLIQWPDIYYHSSEDTPDKLSEETLKIVGAVGASYLYWLANAGRKEAHQLAQALFNEELPKVEKGKPYLKKVLRQKLKSTAEIVPAEERGEFLKELASLIEKTPAPEEIAISETLPELKLIPERKVFGLPSMFSLPEKERENFSTLTGDTLPWSRKLAYLLFLADGQRTLGEILKEIKLIYPDTSSEYIINFFAFLRKHHYIELR
jgi:Zn-dependent M28 family amino/carboxypeptidase